MTKMKQSSSWMAQLLCVAALLIYPIVASGKPKFQTTVISEFAAAAYGGIPTCCPSTPLLYCDFFFEGFEHQLPTYVLKDGLTGDHPLQTEYSRKIHWKGWPAEFSPSVRDSKSGNKAYVGSTWQNGTFLQCPALPKWINTNGQLFISNVGNIDGSKLFARKFQKATPSQWGIKFYRHRCILLPLTQISIPTAKGNLNLDLNDNNKAYPQQRRCVVFKTGV